jgi:hypothetical protein
MFFERRRDSSIVLTYGQESELVKNVLAADGCKLETRGVQYQFLHQPSCYSTRRSLLAIRRIADVSDVAWTTVLRFVARKTL